jgi:hypothetical protein
MPEVSLYGMRPRTGFWTWPSVLFQNDKDGRRGLAERPWSKQPKAANRVLIAFRNVLSPTVNELFQRALHLHTATQLFVLVPEPDCSFPDPGDATLGDGRPPYVASGSVRSVTACNVGPKFLALDGVRLEVMESQKAPAREVFEALYRGGGHPCASLAFAELLLSFSHRRSSESLQHRPR